jgi:hypothetical protein
VGAGFSFDDRDRLVLAGPDSARIEMPAVFDHVEQHLAEGARHIGPFGLRQVPASMSKFLTFALAIGMCRVKSPGEGFSLEEIRYAAQSPMVR